MKEDIEQRAEDYAKESILIDDPSYTSGLFYGYLAGMTEERERGKRFARWAVINGWGFSISREKYYHWARDKSLTPDQLFDIFLLEEKALNN